MTIVHLQTKRKRTHKKMRGLSIQTQKRREQFIGLAVSAAICGMITAAAFNGGFSLQAGKIQMKLDASVSQGLKLSFASI